MNKAEKQPYNRWVERAVQYMNTAVRSPSSNLRSSQKEFAVAAIEVFSDFGMENDYKQIIAFAKMFTGSGKTVDGKS